MEQNLIRTPQGKVSFETIKVFFSEEELDFKRKLHLSESYELLKLEDEKKRIVDEINEKLKQKKAEIKTLTLEVAEGYSYITKNVQLLADDDKRIIEFFDIESGEKLGQREQYPNERIFSI